MEKEAVKKNGNSEERKRRIEGKKEYRRTDGRNEGKAGSRKK